MIKKLITNEEIEDWLVSNISQVLEIEKDEIDTTLTFNRLGVDSITGVQITGDLEEMVGFKIDTVLLFKYPTIEKISSFLSEKTK